MKAFQLPEKKQFMHLLLKSGLFDNFLLSEASIHTAVRYDINGRISQTFYSHDELVSQHLDGLSYMPYGRLRPICYELIKGQHTPSYFKFVLQLSPQNLSRTIQACGASISPDSVNAAFFNILYQNEKLILTTGVSYCDFILDKNFEKEWDKFTISFLKRNLIVFSLL